MAQSKAQKRGLGRGLSALIPTDMDFLAEVARGDFSILSPPEKAKPLARATKTPSDPDTNDSKRAVSRETAKVPGARDELLQTSSEVDGVEEAANVVEGPDKEPDMVRWVEPTLIQANPYQPRRHFDEGEMANLAESIREHGILQPIIVRPLATSSATSSGPGLNAEAVGHRFQLIAGERRWRASQQAGLEQVPVVVREVSDQQALELAIIENVQRHDISALDAALAYKRLAQEFGLSQEKIAARVGKARPSIANTLRLLELPSEAQEAISDGRISEGHGRAILLAPREAQRSVLRAVLRDKHSVRDTEEFARRIVRQSARDAGGSHDINANADAKGSTKSGAQDQKSATIARRGVDEDATVEETLQRALSCRVEVRRRRAGGQIVLFVSDDIQMARLLDVLGAASADTKRK